jgi:trans-aconitate methyltransferase
MTASEQQSDWREWLRRWDAQQSGYLPDREERFDVMFDVLAALLPESFTAVDLACGPGALSERLLARFPAAHSIALDYDPVLLSIGQGALGDQGGRLRWVEADLAAPDWPARLGASSVDAVLSTTALHWLSPLVLMQVYRQLGALIRPGGVFLNGDNIAFPPSMEAMRRAAKTMQTNQQTRTPRAAQAENWKQWWAAIGQEPALAAQLAERQRRYPDATDEEHAPDIEAHELLLRSAGFREVNVIWQFGANRVLMAVR